MARKKQIRRMLASLPNELVKTIPKDKLNDMDYLMAIFIFRRENLIDKKCKTERRALEAKFNSKYNTKNCRPLYIQSKSSSNKKFSKALKREARKNKWLLNELMKIIYNKFPKLIELFGAIKDKRKKGKIRYSMKTICLVRLLALVCGIVSMKEINEKFNTEAAIYNIKLLTGYDIKEIPDWQTIQNVLDTMDINELLQIREYMVKKILESKMFDNLKYRGYTQVLVDATGIANRDYNLNGNCIVKKSKNGKLKYYKYVLEAKIVFGSIVISLDTEWIENGTINNENDKQDCEINAFKRMAERIKKNHPRLKILITGDALYAVTPVFEICKKYGWGYICNLKTKRLKQVAKAFENGQNYIKQSNYKAVKKIEFNGHILTAFSYTEYSKKNNPITFRYVTNLTINEDDIVETVTVGRRRWKIENECFNIQKNGEYCISHLCSRFENTIKVHYLFIQIAHLLRQLLELGSIVVKDMSFDSKREISTYLCESLLSKKIPNLDWVNDKIQLRFDM